VAAIVVMVREGQIAEFPVPEAAVHADANTETAQLSIETAVTHDNVLAFTILPVGGVVRVDDLLNGKEAARVPVCDTLRGGALTEDEISYMVDCGDAIGPRFINTASFQVTANSGQGVPPIPSADIGKKNEVVMLGMIHDGFKTSRRYSLDVLRQAIRAIVPDFVLAEIPPNRIAAAIKGFEETGRVSEPRTGVFPEYVDVLFPLTREMDFRIIGVAAWNLQMNEYRRAARRRLRNDPAMAHAWSDDEEASAEFSAALSGRAYDPVFIHSDEFDEITRRAFVPDVEYFNAALGPGGWKNINQAHYRLIERALNRHSGTGKRFLITFGASHKYWFLEELRKRGDIVLLDPLDFIPLVE
jgi:hypothetical protein